MLWHIVVLLVAAVTLACPTPTDPAAALLARYAPGSVALSASQFQDLATNLAASASCSADNDDVTAVFERYADDNSLLDAVRLGDAAVELVALRSTCARGENRTAAVFVRFDADGDGAWSRDDVRAFAAALFFNASIHSSPDTACVDLGSIVRTTTSGGRSVNVSHLAALTLQLAWARSEGDVLCGHGAAVYMLEKLLAALAAGVGSDDERLDVGQFSALVSSLTWSQRHPAASGAEARTLKQDSLAASVVPSCAPAATVFARYDLNNDTLLDGDELNLAVVEVALMVSHGCFAPRPVTPEPKDSCSRSTRAQAWGFGFLTVLVISVVSVLGVGALIVFHHLLPRMRSLAMPVLIAFSVGALAGNALLNIFPQIWRNESASKTRWLTCVTLAAIVALFALESGLKLAGRRLSAGKKKGQGQAAASDSRDVEVGTATPGDGVSRIASADPATPLSPSPRKSTLEIAQDELRAIAAQASVAAVSDSCCRYAPPGAIKPIAWLFLLSGLVGDVVDGVALGAAWSADVTVGLSTAVAICCHEVPQDISDFAIYVGSGMVYWQALVCNLLSATFCAIGLVIGVAISSSSSEANAWLLAFAGGAFLYVGLTSMMRELRNENRTVLAIVAQTLSLSLGFGAMVALSALDTVWRGC